MVVEGVSTESSQPVVSRAVANSVWNVAAFGVSVSVAFVATPITLRLLGTSQYGLLTLLMAILAPLGLANLSLGQATVKYVSEAYGRGQPSESGPYVQTTLLFNIGVGILGAALISLSANTLVTGIFRIAPADQSLARHCLYWVAGGWVVTQVSATFIAVPKALQRYDLVSAGTALYAMVSTGVGLAVLFTGGDLESFIQSQFAAQAARMVAWYFVAGYLLPRASLVPRWHPEAFKRSLEFGFWQTVATIGGLASDQTDKYVLGALLPTADVGLYGVASTVEQPAVAVAFKAADVLFPTFSYIRGSMDKHKEILLLIRASWLLTTISTSIMVCLIVWGRDFLALWVGADIANSTYRLMQILALAGLIGSTSSVANSYLLGIGKTTWTAAISLSTGAVVLVGSLLLIPHFGLEGAGWSSVAAMTVQASAVAAMWHAFFREEVRSAEYAAAVFGPIPSGLLVCAVLLAIRSFLPSPLGWAEVGTAALLTAATVMGVIAVIDIRLPGGVERSEGALRVAKHLLTLVRARLPR